jgi:type I restriction enzyme S subunit
MSVINEYNNLVRLGDYIELSDERNSDGLYTLDNVRGISILKKFIPTKADMQDVSLSPYKLVKPGEFSYVTVTSRNGGKISLAINDSNETYLVSSSYEVFKSKNTEELLPEYLYLFLSREEFDRFSRFNSWGSARETFDWNEFCRIQIPLPDIDIQQELVDTYNGLKALAELNEALIKPLTEACQAYIVDCKKKYPEVELGEYLEEVDERNTTNEITLTQGVDVNMHFIPAKREAADKEGTKIVRTGQFAFNRVVKANGTKLPIALRIGPDCIISSSYAVFQINNQELDAKFLRLWFSRSEVHRYCGFISQGTTRDVFSFDDLCNMKIPIPPPEVQQAIVNIYNCAEEAKNIANEARKKMKTLCPALVQRAING